MHPWFSSRLERHPSHKNTAIAIILFAIISVVVFHVFRGASIYFGRTRPVLQSVETILLLVMGLAIVLFLVGPPRLPKQQKFSLSALLMLAVALSASIGFYSFANYAWSGDEYAYLFGADTLKELRLWNTPPPLGGAETTSYIWIKDGKWVGQYPPGWPIILAMFGGSFPTGRFANGVCTAIAAYSVFELVKVRANRDAAWIAALFFVLSPFTLFNGGSLFAHSSAAAMCGLTMLVSFKAKNSQKIALLLALGACIGMLGIIRNVAAFAIIIAVAIEQFRSENLIRRIVLIGMGGVPFLVGLLVYQYEITGDPTMPVYWYAGRTVDHLYFDWPSIQLGLRRILLNQGELMLFTSPVILPLWLAALWKLFKNKALSASDIILPLGMIIFIFYPLYPGHRVGPRYYFDFWPLAVVTLGTALPSFSAGWRNLYSGAIAISIIYGGVVTAFLAVELREIILSRYDIYEVAKTNKMSNSVVCAVEIYDSDDVYAKQEYFAVARNGLDMADSKKASEKDVIFVNCREIKYADIKAVYPDRTIWQYKAGAGKYSGTMHLMPN